ncbi:MAG: NAD-dependent dehydratase [Opitutales bacterium]|nr:NAD-dependent dehydratase [Opitutales bacterium]|tara:strand:+ start:1834 stop:2799 length:966 start_codon:yes stop_codon:yes gene_type:complete
MKKYFVTGGSGFIGSSLSKKLLKMGNEVVIFDDFSRGNMRRIESIKRNIEIVNGDIRDQDKLIKHSKGSDVFVHLAAINGTKFFYEKPQEVLDVSIKGILSVVNACKKNMIVNLTFSSSSEVYQQPTKVPTPEEVPLIIPDVFNPRYSYGAGKIISEIILLNYFKDFFKKIIIFRPHNVYGPDMGWEHVIPEMIKKAEVLCQTNNIFEILGDGNQTRSFIYIDDFTDCLWKVITRGKHRNIYHIGNEDEITIKSLAEKVINHYTKDFEFSFLKCPFGETSKRCPKTDKIKGLGYKQKVNLDLGIKNVVEWYTNNLDLEKEL